MTSVKDDVPDHAMALIARAGDAFRRDVLQAAAAAPPPLPHLRGSQIRLLQLTPSEGMRATDLATRADMTKQALGELAASLEALGLLESVRDPGDARVRIWRPTRIGREAAAESHRVVGRVERAWRRRIGSTEWEALRHTLARMAELGPVSESRPRKDTA